MTQGVPDDLLTAQPDILAALRAIRWAMARAMDGIDRLIASLGGERADA